VSLESIRYRDWSGRLRPSWFACWPIARTGLLLVLRRKLFWILLGLALFNFLFLFAMIYLKFQFVSQRPGMARFIDGILSAATGTGETYRDFMSAQASVTMLLLAFAGAMLVGDDMRQGGLTFYLSRRVGRWHYVVGKLLSIGLLVSLTTTIPALILFVQYGYLTDSTDYFSENLGILRGILGYGLVLSITLSLLLFAMASWLQKTVPLVMSWAFVFLMLPALAELLRSAFDDRHWRLMALWHDIRLMGTWCFGGIDTNRELQLLPPAVVIVLLVCVFSLIAIIPRVRAVRVVQ